MRQFHTFPWMMWLPLIQACIMTKASLSEQNQWRPCQWGCVQYLFSGRQFFFFFQRKLFSGWQLFFFQSNEVWKKNWTRNFFSVKNFGSIRTEARTRDLSRLSLVQYLVWALSRLQMVYKRPCLALWLCEWTHRSILAGVERRLAECQPTRDAQVHRAC